MSLRALAKRAGVPSDADGMALERDRLSLLLREETDPARRKQLARAIAGYQRLLGETTGTKVAAMSSMPSMAAIEFAVACVVEAGGDEAAGVALMETRLAANPKLAASLGAKPTKPGGVVPVTRSSPLAGGPQLMQAERVEALLSNLEYEAQTNDRLEHQLSTSTGLVPAAEIERQLSAGAGREQRILDTLASLGVTVEG